MPIDGVVEQTQEGRVLSCTNSQRCFMENGGVSKGIERTCLLSVNHADRCKAWQTDRFKWLIDADTSKIKQLP